MKPTFIILLSLVAVTACKNSSQQPTQSDTAIHDSAKELQAIQHNFPPEPVENINDTSFTVAGNKHKLRWVQKTIDTSMVVIARKVMGKVIKDVYFDFEYLIAPTGANYEGNTIMITKQNFAKDFNDDFLKNGILHQIEFTGFNESSKEYEFKFLITKPDTDISYIIYYFVNNKGETIYEIEDFDA